MGDKASKPAQRRNPNSQSTTAEQEKKKQRYEVKDQGEADATTANLKANLSPMPQKEKEQNPNAAQAPPKYSWEKKKRDLSNFQFMNENDKLLVKQPGSLNGQQFRIQNCKECNIYVHDNHDQCTIDLCENSVIVMGPCSSSTFIRNCKDCLIVVTCQQLRMRDCHNLEIMLFSQTQPVIESSSNFKFYCHQYNYPELTKQMQAAKVSYWNNKWHDIYDFTPPKRGDSQHYTLINERKNHFVSSLKDLQNIVSQIEKKKGYELQTLKEIVAEDLKGITLTDDSCSEMLIPMTLPSHEESRTIETLFILILLKPTETFYSQAVLEFNSVLQSLLLQTDSRIEECRNTECTMEQLKQLEPTLNLKGVQPAAKGVMTLGIQIKTNMKKGLSLKELAKTLQSQSYLQLHCTTNEKEAERVAGLMFRQFNIEHTGHNIKQ